MSVFFYCFSLPDIYCLRFFFTNDSFSLMSHFQYIMILIVLSSVLSVKHGLCSTTVETHVYIHVLLQLLQPSVKLESDSLYM